MRAKEIEAAAIKLPKRERLRLARRLLKTLPVEEGKEDPEILDAWIAEAERRADELESGTVIGVPAADVLKRLRTKLRG
jgi:putative addiction module component (TIGR02574 family)